MHLLFSLVLPWIVFFLMTVVGHIVLSLKAWQIFQVLSSHSEWILGIGSLICLYFNFRTISNVGIWVSDRLPQSVRFEPQLWLFRAVVGLLLAGILYLTGKFSWVPLFWQGIVLPFTLTLFLFFIIWNFLGPILKWSSKFSWSRSATLLAILPVFAFVPEVAVFLGNVGVSSFHASRPDLGIGSPAVGQRPQTTEIAGQVLSVARGEMRIYAEYPQGSGEKKTLEVQLDRVPKASVEALPKNPAGKDIKVKLAVGDVNAVDIKSSPNNLAAEDIETRLKSEIPAEKAAALREISEFSSSCDDYSKSIWSNLDPKGDKDVVYWAIQGLKCANVKTVVALPRLVDVMMKHKDPLVRAASITAMKKFGNENVKNVEYLLVKRISEKEPPEVITATAAIMASLDGDSAKYATSRLKTLLDIDGASIVAAKNLIQNLRRDDLITEYIQLNIVNTDASRERAVAMICLLPEEQRIVAGPHIDSVLQTVKSISNEDAGIAALRCLGRPAFDAVKGELAQPKILKREQAAGVFANLDIKSFPDSLKIASECARDKDENVRQFCSQSLGSLGAPALSDILTLLRSSESRQREAGQNALAHFEDANAETELRKVVQENSGWTATNKRLQIAKVLGTALVRIEQQGSTEIIAE